MKKFLLLLMVLPFSTSLRATTYTAHAPVKCPKCKSVSMKYFEMSYNDFYRNGKNEEAETNKSKKAFRKKVTEFIATLDDTNANDRIFVGELYR